jgi:predicted nucleotidyltransferase
VLRPLLAVRWIRLNRSKFQFAPSAVMPPVPFNTLLQSTLYDDSVSKEIQRLLDIKMASSEAQESEPWPILQAFILSELEKAKVTAMSDQHHSDFDVNGFAHLIICAHD